VPLGRVLLLVLWLTAAGLCVSQEPPEPPEEDETLAAKEYSLNPIQAQKELQIGNFYFRKGSYRAAAGRFLEATKWNPGLAEAYLRLGEAYEKLKATSQARQAYEKFLELDPKNKQADNVRKRLKALPADRDAKDPAGKSGEG
jgi:Tfp pilus assembly protein PilF